MSAIELEASQFAEAFLMPAVGIAADLDPPITLTKLAPLKGKWGVSLQSLVRRARSTGAINENQYTYLFQQIGRRGWRLREPENLDLPIEKPRTVRKIIEVLYGDPPDYRRVAADFRLYPQQVKQIMDGYATKSELPARGAVDQPRLIAFPRPSLAAPNEDGR